MSRTYTLAYDCKPSATLEPEAVTFALWLGPPQSTAMFHSRWVAWAVESDPNQCWPILTNHWSCHGEKIHIIGDIQERKTIIVEIVKNHEISKEQNGKSYEILETNQMSWRNIGAPAKRQGTTWISQRTSNISWYTRKKIDCTLIHEKNIECTSPTMKKHVPDKSRQIPTNPDKSRKIPTNHNKILCVFVFLLV